MEHQVDGRRSRGASECRAVISGDLRADLEQNVRSVHIIFARSGHVEIERRVILNGADRLVFDDACFLNADLGGLHFEKAQLRFRTTFR